MSRLTIVRSLVGQTLELPGEIFIRPWCFIELEEMSTDMVQRLKILRDARVVQLAQVIDGAPRNTLELEKSIPVVTLPEKIVQQAEADLKEQKVGNGS